MITYTNTYENLIKNGSLSLLGILHATDEQLEFYPTILNQNSLEKELFVVSLFIGQLTSFPIEKIKDDINKYIKENKQDFLKAMNKK